MYVVMNIICDPGRGKKLRCSQGTAINKSIKVKIRGQKLVPSQCIIKASSFRCDTYTTYLAGDRHVRQATRIEQADTQMKLLSLSHYLD